MIACMVVLCLAAIIAALIYVTRKETRKKTKAMEEGLSMIANEKRLNLDKKEVFRNRLVAMDTKKEMLVYVQLKNDKVEADVVDLWQMNSCEVIQTDTRQKERNVRDLKINYEPVAAVHLQFKGAHNLVFNIGFYNEIEDGAAEMLAYTEKAIAWRDIIGNLKKTAVLS